MNVLLSKKHHRLKTIQQQQQHDQSRNYFHALKPIRMQPPKTEQLIKKKHERVRALESKRLSTHVFSYPTDHFQCWVHPIVSKTPDHLFQNKFINGKKNMFGNKFQSIQEIKKQILTKSSKIVEHKCVTEPASENASPEKIYKFNIRSLSRPKNQAYSNVLFQFTGQQFAPRKPLFSQVKTFANK